MRGCVVRLPGARRAASLQSPDANWPHAQPRWYGSLPHAKLKVIFWPDSVSGEPPLYLTVVPSYLIETEVPVHGAAGSVEPQSQPEEVNTGAERLRAGARRSMGA